MPIVTMLGGARVGPPPPSSVRDRDPFGPGVLLQAVIEQVGKDPDGILVRALGIPWIEIMSMIANDPSVIYQIDARKWEEIIAAAYDRAGYLSVLTPRSGDLGRDVVATMPGIGSVRIYDQVKAYSPGHLVTANDVRALNGILEGNVSKGVITTTTDFAPGVYTDPILSKLMPYRLELKPRDKLLPWLESLSDQNVK